MVALSNDTVVNSCHRLEEVSTVFAWKQVLHSGSRLFPLVCGDNRKIVRPRDKAEKGATKKLGHGRDLRINYALARIRRVSW